MRLQEWLRAGGGDLVRGRPLEIDRFNADRVAGPARDGEVRWVPNLLRPQRADSRLWAFPLAAKVPPEGVPSVVDATVAVFDDAAYNRGLVPTRYMEIDDPHLIELVAVDMTERGFTAADLAADGLEIGEATDGRAYIEYRVRDELVDEYKRWSEEQVGRHVAIIAGGMIIAVPYYLQGSPGRGHIVGEFTRTEAEDLVSRFRLGELPCLPVMLSTSSH